MRAPTWGRWLLATTLGGVAGNSAVAVLLAIWTGGAGALEESAAGGVAIAVVWVAIWWVGAAIGLGIGLGQWRVLSKAGACGHRPQGRGHGVGWVAASVAGGLLPWWPLLFALVLGGTNGGQPVTDAGGYVGGVTAAAALFAGLPGGICGIVPGIGQGLILKRLRPRAPKHSLALWIAATAIGWGVSWALEGAALGVIVTSLGVRGPLTPVLLVGGLLVLAGCWAVTGALTGGALIATTSAETAGTGAPRG